MISVRKTKLSEFILKTTAILNIYLRYLFLICSVPCPNHPLQLFKESSGLCYGFSLSGLFLAFMEESQLGTSQVKEKVIKRGLSVYNSPHIWDRLSTCV